MSRANGSKSDPGSNKFLDIRMEPPKPRVGFPRDPAYVAIEEAAREGAYNGVWTAVLIAPGQRRDQIANALKRAGVLRQDYVLSVKNAAHVPGMEDEGPGWVHFIYVTPPQRPVGNLNSSQSNETGRTK